MRYIIASFKTIPHLLAALVTCASAVRAEVPVVVTDIPPVHALAAAVMDGVGTPELLLPQGASEHGYQLRPSQAQAVASAGLVIWVGPELTPWLEDPLANRPAAAAVLGLLAAKGTHVRDYGDAEAAGGHAGPDHEKGHDTEQAGQDHAGEEHKGDEHADEDHEDHAGHVHSGADPHAWLDPANGKVWVDLIARTLSDLDPANADTYGENARRAVAEIDAADAAVRRLLDPVRDVPFVAFHDAYGYFTAQYGLTLAGTIALGDAALPGARHLADLEELIARSGAVCIFPEAQHDDALVVQLAESASVRAGGAIDPVGSTLAPGPQAYTALLTGLATTIAACLGDG